MPKDVFMRRSALALAGLALLTGSATIAQEQEPVQDPAQAQQQEGASVPEDAVIPEQEAEHTLAQDLIGLPVLAMNADGTAEERIGTIDTLLFDADDAITGIVIGIGGFLGIGAKSVAIAYDQVEVRQEEGMPVAAAVGLTREQLENAPDFRSQAALEAERQRQQMEQQGMQDMEGMQEMQPPPETQ